MIGETLSDMPRIPVMAAVIQREDCVLLGLRPRHKRHGGLWEFPGGKVDRGESSEDALRRELREELNVDLVWCGPILYVVRDPGSDFEIQFVRAEIVGVPEPIEHEILAWVAVGDLLGLPLAPSDAQFAATLP